MDADPLRTTRIRVALGAIGIGVVGVALTVLGTLFIPSWGARGAPDAALVPIGVALFAGALLGVYGASKESGSAGCLAFVAYALLTCAGIGLGIVGAFATE